MCAMCFCIRVQMSTEVYSVVNNLRFLSVKRKKGYAATVAVQMLTTKLNEIMSKQISETEKKKRKTVGISAQNKLCKKSEFISLITGHIPSFHR